MNIDEEVKEVKKALRSRMNGVLSAHLRQAGMPYKWIMGVTLPELRIIAQEFQPHAALAQKLWDEPMRECRLLAPMLMPHNQWAQDLAEIWVEEAETEEVAQVMTMELIAGMPHAAELSFEWIASDHPMRHLCGFLCISRLLSQGATLNPHSLAELHSQAESLLPNASLALKKAIMLTLEKTKENLEGI